MLSESYSNKLVKKIQEIERIDLKSKNKSIEDRATLEQVLDQRTMLILQKLHNSGLLVKLNGCVATGKEANVYHSIVSTDKLLENSSLTQSEINKYKDY